MPIKTLTEKSLKKHWKSIRQIDLSRMKLFEKWKKANFLRKAPLKFSLSVIGLENGEVTGFIVASKKNGNAHIHRLAVVSSHIKRGIGSQLVSGLIERARKHKIKKAEVETLWGEGIERFYQKNGFKIMGKKDLDIYTAGREENLRRKTIEKSIVLYKNLQKK